MKAAWKGDVFDFASWNSNQVEDVDIAKFEELYYEDVAATKWDREIAGVLNVSLSL